MIWRVIYSPEAKQDLWDISINYYLGRIDNGATKKLLNKLFRAISSLSQMPMRHKLCEKKMWGIQGLRKFPVDGYVIYYQVVESLGQVNIIRIMHSKRNTKSQPPMRLSDQTIQYKAAHSSDSLEVTK